jgi:hypothetical protein
VQRRHLEARTCVNLYWEGPRHAVLSILDTRSHWPKGSYTANSTAIGRYTCRSGKIQADHDRSVLVTDAGSMAQLRQDLKGPDETFGLR